MENRLRTHNTESVLFFLGWIWLTRHSEVKFTVVVGFARTDDGHNDRQGSRLRTSVYRFVGLCNGLFVFLLCCGVKTELAQGVGDNGYQNNHGLGTVQRAVYVLRDRPNPSCPLPLESIAGAVK